VRAQSRSRDASECADEQILPLDLGQPADRPDDRYAGRNSQRLTQLGPVTRTDEALDVNTVGDYMNLAPRGDPVREDLVSDVSRNAAEPVSMSRG
jgi:hypothetical protein